MRTFIPIGLVVFALLVTPEAQAVLQSGVSQEVQEQIRQEEPAPEPASNKRTVHIKVRTKPAAEDASSNSADTTYEETENSTKPDDNFFKEEDSYGMNYSKNVHPASTKPDGTSPVVQTVSGPQTMNYGRPQPASVLYPGKPQGGGSGTMRVRSKSQSQPASSY